jgi:hypothetical protein
MRGTLPWRRRLRPIPVLSIHQARVRIGVVSGEFDINVSAAVDLLVRAKFPSERVDDRAFGMNGLACARAFRPSGLSRKNVDAHRVNKPGIVGHGNSFLGLNAVRKSQSPRRGSETKRIKGGVPSAPPASAVAEPWGGLTPRSISARKSRSFLESWGG